MLVRRSNKNRRGGMAAVETALVMLPMIMFMCGVFEYGRLLMVWNITNNAAREGCRYALANNTVSTIATDVTNTVTTKMAGLNTSSFTTFTVTLSGTHAGASAAVTSLVPGDMVSVAVSGKFRFMNIIPVVPMPSLTITSTVTMVCEGGT